MQALEARAADPAAGTVLTTRHLRRLRGYWRSAGWPCHDALDVDLLAAGLVERCAPDANGLEALRVTDAGVGALERDFARTRSALDRHDALVERVARALVQEGRIVFRGLALRAPAERRWQPVKPDVFSIRNSPREALLAPLVHEIKVSRTDLLADLRRAGKRGAYQAISQQCYYVIAEGIADPSEIPHDCGVVVARETCLERVRLSPVRDVRLATLHWIALAKGRAEYGADPADAQLGLGEVHAGEPA